MRIMKSVLSRRVIFDNPSLKNEIFKEIDKDAFYIKLTSTIKNKGVLLSSVSRININSIFKRRGYFYLRLTITDKFGKRGYTTLAIGEPKPTVFERLVKWLLP